MKQKPKIATGLTLMLAVATVCAQDGAPLQDGQEPQGEGEQVAAEKPKPVMPEVSVGWSQWGLTGNARRFRQYATPPKGFYLEQLNYLPVLAAGRHDLSLRANTPGQDDYRLAASTRINFGATSAAIDTSRHMFYEPTPALIPNSEREITKGHITQRLSSDMALTFSAKMDQQDSIFAPPLDPRHQRTRHWKITADGTVFRNGFLSLNYTDFRYWDRTNVLYDSETQRLGASYTHDLTDDLTLGAQISRSVVRLPGITSNNVESWSMNGSWRPACDTRVLGEFVSEALDLPIVHNAFNRRRTLARTRLIQNYKGWTGQLGYSRLDLQRVTDDHTMVETPKWHTFEAQISGKLTSTSRVSGKLIRRSLDGDATMYTDDTRVLYWRDRLTAQLKLDVTNDLASAYLVFGTHQNKNDVRGVRVESQTITVGGSAQATPQLDLYFETTSDIWTGHSSDPLLTNLSQYLPDGTVVTFGANYQLSETARASFNYTQFATFNDNPLGLPDGNVRGRQITGSVNYTFPNGFELGVSYAPWHFKDRILTQNDYTSKYLTITGQMRF